MAAAYFLGAVGFVVIVSFLFGAYKITHMLKSNESDNKAMGNTGSYRKLILKIQYSAIACSTFILLSIIGSIVTAPPMNELSGQELTFASSGRFIGVFLIYIGGMGDLFVLMHFGITKGPSSTSSSTAIPQDMSSNKGPQLQQQETSVGGVLTYKVNTTKTLTL
jgi:hypothetical protein